KASEGLARVAALARSR
nr:Chain C, ANTI-INDUCER PEPTIDE TAP1 [Escherichia coli]